MPTARPQVYRKTHPPDTAIEHDTCTLWRGECLAAGGAREMQDGVATHLSSEEPSIEAFNALLWGLLSSGLLVEVDPQGSPPDSSASPGPASPDPASAGRTDRWRLSPAAQRRLDELARRRTYQPENLVYFDHRCGTCGERRPTRLRSGRYLCDPCQYKETVPADPVPISRQGRLRLGRSRIARSARPVAGEQQSQRAPSG